MRTYYDILSISPRATDEEVRQAYRVLARRYHPDRNPGQKKAQQAFIRIHRAYSMLRTKPQRAAYNRYLLNQIRQSRPAVRQPGRTASFLILLKDIFWPFTLGREVPHG